LYYDTRVGKQGLWFASSPNAKTSPVLAPKKIFKTNYPMTVEISGRYVFYSKNAGELRRISLPDGNDERMPGSYPGLNQQSQLDVTLGGKEIVYSDNRLNSKLVKIENLFK
jgi:hypothetical protein